MICCFRKNEQLFSLQSLVHVDLFDGESISEPTRWTGFLEAEGGRFKQWLNLPGAQLGEIKADMIGADCENNGNGIWAHLPTGTGLAVVVFQTKVDKEMRLYRPAKILTRPAPELKSFFNCDRYPLVGRLSGSLVFRRASRDLILRS